MWNAKMCVSKTSPVIGGITDSVVIAQRFADSFMNNGTPVYDSNYANMSSFISALHTAETSDNMNIKHVDVEMVSKCLAKMKKCKAPDWDGIEAEHLTHAHSILIIQLCILFNVMMQHSVVPQAFNNGISIPILKDKRGNATDINNYRAITLSPSTSKLFEMCTLEIYSEVFVTSPLQFGFKKKLGTGHALFTLRCAVDYYVTNGSTVNVALLDISKAFDRVCHVTMFRRLLNKGMPLNIVRLLI